MAAPDQQVFGNIPVDRIEAQMAKVLASGTFAQSKRLQRFLRFTVEHALRGEGDQLKEYSIGTAVYDRSGSYDPRVDSIVRVEARRLRSKLKKYYETEGKSDSLLIDYQEGSYIPLFREPAPAAPAPASAREAKPAADARKAIVVLPFVNLSADPENEYFADGMTEELINALTRIDSVQVVARTSAFQFKGQSVDVRTIGEKLGVQLVLEGSVRKAGERIRVAAQLINVADGYHIWSRTFDRDWKDVFAVQDEISGAIATAIGDQFGTTTRRRGTRHSGNPDTYNLYLRGRFHWNKATVPDFRKAIEYFEQILAVHPRDARALVGVADSYGCLAYWGALSPDEGMGRAKETVLKALEIDPELIEGHTSLAAIAAFYEWDWEAAERSFEAALGCGCYATAHHWYGLYLAARGRFEESKAQLERAMKIDPLSPTIVVSLGVSRYFARQYDEALAHFRKALEMDQNYLDTYGASGLALLAHGLYTEAIASLELVSRLSQDSPIYLGTLGYAYGKAGRNVDAALVLRRMEDSGAFVPALSRALISLGLGLHEETVGWLEVAFQQRASQLIFLNVEPQYDEIRNNPGFERLVARLRF